MGLLNGTDDNQWVNQLTNKIHSLIYLFRKFSEHLPYPGAGHWGFNGDQHRQFLLSRLYTSMKNDIEYLLCVVIC